MPSRRGAPAVPPAPPQNTGAGLFTWIALSLGLCAVSTGAIFARLASVPALTSAAYRMGLASLIALPAGLILGRKELSSLGPGDWRDLALAGFFLALHFASWIASLTMTTVASSVLLCSTSPLWTAVLSPWITGKRLSRNEKRGLLLSLAGALAVGYGNLSGGSRALMGDGLALVGAVAFALYLLIGQRVRRSLSIGPYAGLCYSSAALWLFALAWLAGAPLRGFEAPVWKALWALALIPQILGHSAYNWALKKISALMASLTILGEPVMAGLLAWLLFGERPGPVLVAGGGLMLAGILAAGRPDRAP